MAPEMDDQVCLDGWMVADCLAVVGEACGQGVPCLPYVWNLAAVASDKVYTVGCCVWESSG